jgi:outer membrane protein OmpA-like peptidoglycan-associated protein
MRHHILQIVRPLAAFLPMLVLAQPVAAQRVRSWELTAGGGAAYTDGALASFLGSNGFTTSGSKPNRFMPAAAVRLGYNVTESFGFSIGTAGATGSGVRYLTPFAAATYTANLNARFSPFLTGGTQFTRITGNGRKVHPTWGAHLGVGVRSMIDSKVAVRLEGRMAMEHYADLPGAKTAYNSIVTLSLSYFTAGRGAPTAMAAMPAMPAASCPVCALARVDTVWRTPPPAAPPPPLVLRDTLVLEGINFAFDSSALTPESYAILDRVAQALLVPEWANSRWQIAGHTSGIGTPEYNMALSQRRAEAVRAYLVSRGVPNSRLTSVGFGEANPMYPNDSEGRNWRNRRVELRRMRP